MDKHRGKSSVFIICMLFIFVFVSGAERQEKQEQKKEEEEKPSIFHAAKSLFTVDTSSPISGRSYWEKVKTAIDGVPTYFFPPNLDFRGRNEAVNGGEKVKEAVAKSLEKSKASVEESAKSAAEIAGKTMQKTKDMVKKSFSLSEL